MSERSGPSSTDRWSVLSRVLAAVVGGYAFATMSSTLLSQVLPMSRAQAVGTAVLSSFAIYAAAVLWVFAARTASRAWVGLVLPTLACGAMWWLIR